MTKPKPLIILGEQSYETRQLIRNSGSFGFQPFKTTSEKLMKAVARHDHPIVLVRTGVDTPNRTIADLSRLEMSARATVVNSTGVLRVAKDKLVQAELFDGLGIPTPETLPAEDRSDAKDLASQLGLPLFVKARCATEGRACFVVETLERLQQLIENHGPGQLIAQRIIRHGGCDTRVHVIRHRSMPPMLRKARGGRLITNASLGASCHRSDDPEACEMATAVSSQLGAFHIGADVVRDVTINKRYILEINASAGFEAYDGTANTEAAGCLAGDLLYGLMRQHLHTEMSSSS